MRRARVVATLALLVLAAVLYRPAADAVFAARLLWTVRALSRGSTATGLAVRQSKLARTKDGVALEALVYSPAETIPDRAVVLVPGVSELGCYHPRLIALARSLADRGFLVLTPDIGAFRRFRVPPESLDEIAFWFRELDSVAGPNGIRRAGLAGISFSGTLCVLAAARPDVRERVAFVLAIGPYASLERLSRAWFAAGPITVSDGTYPTRYYGRWILMLQALDALGDPRGRAAVDLALRKLLLEGKAPAAENLSREPERWRALATAREDRTDAELACAIDAHLARLYRRLDPRPAAAELRCPLFVAHGASDDLIPPDEGRQLAAMAPPGLAHVLVSPFLTHTHPLERSLTLAEKGRALPDMLGFFYRLARAAR